MTKQFEADRPADRTLRARPSRLGPTPPIDTALKETNGWLHPQQLFVDLFLPGLELQRAIEQGDHAAIWRHYRTCADPTGFLDWLGNLVGIYEDVRPHMRDPQRTTTFRHSLIAAPAILMPAMWNVSPPPRHDSGAASEVGKRIQAWLGKRQDTAIVTPAIRYEDVCRWSPLTQREYLLALDYATPKRRAPLLGAIAPLDARMPQLVFLVGRAQRWLAFPELPEARSTEDAQLREHIAGHLAYTTHRPVTPQDVRVPALFVQAVLDGLQMWIASVAALDLARSWQLHPVQDDVVLLELSCADAQMANQILPIRLHQIGLHGLDLLMEQLTREIGPASASAEQSH